MSTAGSTLDRSRNALTLAFRDPALERAFQAESAVTNAPEIRMGSLASVALWLLGDLLAHATIAFHPPALDLICGGMALLNGLAFLAIKRWATTMNRQQLVALLLNGLAGLAVLLLLQLSGAERLAGPAILLIAMFAFVAVRLRFVLGLIAAGMYLAGCAAILFRHQGQSGTLEVFLVAAAIGVGLAGTYLLERGARDVYAQRRLIEAQAAALREAQANSERLLLNVLPGSIAERLKRGEKTIVDAFDDATVLFADLVGFTPLAARLSPQDTLALLDRLFTGFDALAERHGVEKIKTIGDAYMVVGGLPEPSTDHPARVVAMGLDMLVLVAAVAAELGHRLELRVGVHTGPLAAGVIGTRKFSYDLWGDTVNVASRLESHGVVGAIQISEATWQRISHALDAAPRGRIALKGRGDIAAFLVTPSSGTAAAAAVVEQAPTS
ncbi:MAG: adenylate/guanylate cyclase domain-containing protein [Deltaproteobacteria bacterium]|nr:adenylate/guanylate cyclase domain-containing protein [Deltaproteobacteria bacterium]